MKKFCLTITGIIFGLITLALAVDCIDHLLALRFGMGILNGIIALVTCYITKSCFKKI